MERIAVKNGRLMQGSTPVLLRGFGLGGWFLPEGYMWKFYTKCDRPRRIEALISKLCGEEYAEGFWEQYLDTYIKYEELKLIRDNGFNSIRLPLNARHLYYEGREGYILNQPVIERIDKVMSWCRELELYIILDMHGAPGGQTGQNIDDCENDYPELFTSDPNKEALIWLWRELAARYADEPCLAGYDLLNEPLVNLFSRHYHKLLPLYRELICAIRAVDKEHVIILEGVHWATDFSVFDDFTPEEAGDNIMLQFHKYWSNPDKESIASFVTTAQRLNVPLFMGEGGENNCDWYTTMFSMLERERISWSFWSFKKMGCDNSPVSFKEPEGWNKIIEFLDGSKAPEREEAIEIFDEFLYHIKSFYVNQQVFQALSRQAPVKIPGIAFEEGKGSGGKENRAFIRASESIAIEFLHGEEREPDFKRYGGEDQPESESLFIKLYAGDFVKYQFKRAENKFDFMIEADGNGKFQWELEGEEIQCLCITCKEGMIKIFNIMIDC